MDSIQDKQEKVQNPVSEMKFSGFWRNHRVFGFDQTPKSSGNKKQQSSRFKFNYMIFLRVRTGNKDSKEREEFGKNQPPQGYFFSEEPGD